MFNALNPETVIAVLDTEIEKAKTLTDLAVIQGRAVNLTNGILSGTFSLFNNAACEVLDLYRARYHEVLNGDEEDTGMHASREAVADGTYTVELPDGNYYTVEVEVLTKGALEGKRIASYLNGPDNDTHFKGFGFVNEDGSVTTWKSAREAVPTAKLWGYTEAVKTVMGFPNLAPEFREAYALKSGRCARCHKTLTVPSSLHAGVGPECAKHFA